VENKLKFTDRVLRKQQEFENLKTSGQRMNVASWLVINFRKNDLGHLRYGFTISRKVGSAVVRNKLRRWSREFLRLQLKAGIDPSLDINVVFRPSKNEFYKQLSHSEVDGRLGIFFAKINKSR
jgi:ribonuclease P protein component